MRDCVQGMRLVCVAGQQGAQDVTQMTFKQATEVFRTAGRPVTLTMSLPDQQASQLQISAVEQAQSALEKLHELQAQAALITQSNAGTGHAGDAREDVGASNRDGLVPVSVEEGLPPAQPSVHTAPLIVSCPEGVCEGHRLIVTAPDGRELEIEVPLGVFSGDEFEIHIGE
jgi:hypothetical protein